ncbi:MAG: glycosyltransferase, partial [Bacteroidetes bacterium]|nr:glycosyltransferase [Bacteroidota bacterium]
STDKTEQIIQSFNDPRIVYVKNEKNSGLIFTLNKAIDLSKGNYIARMDADDICLPDRLKLQKEMFDQNPRTGIVAGVVQFINENDEPAGDWALDKKTLSPEAIRKSMIKENCIAHPTIMAKTNILQQYKYKDYQKNIEDYDCWLRMLNAGIEFRKVAEPVLLYRVHNSSVTSIHLKKVNFFFKHVQMKRKFIANEWHNGHITIFTFKVLLSVLADILKGWLKELKNTFRK